MKAASFGPLERQAAAGIFATVFVSVALFQLLLWGLSAEALLWQGSISLIAAMLAAIAAALTLRHQLSQVENLASLLELREPLQAPPFPPDPLGELTGAIISLRTRLSNAVEAKRKVRRQAEETDRYETEFLKSLSHELRTPLNAIVGFTQVLLEEIDGPITPSQREDLETILTSGTHLTELVDDVLDLAAMQSARFQLERAPLDARKILESVATLMQGQRRGRDVAVELVLPDSPLMVFADAKRLRQVCTNLASNAMKFTEQGFVRLVGEHREGEVCLAVEDSGPGISSDDLALIFEEFAQVGDVRRKGQGSGLGLAICKRLVALHRGKITVESVVGRGSAFRVHLSAWVPKGG